MTALSSLGFEQEFLPLVIALIIFVLFILSRAMAAATIAVDSMAVSLGCVGAVLSWVWPQAALLYGAVGLLILAALNLKLIREKPRRWYFLGPSPLRVIKEDELKTVVTALAMLVPTTISFVLRIVFIANDI